MKAECNAKINIGLHVVAKRPDGYHDIETLFYPLPFSDYLEISASGKDSFEQTGAALDCPPEKNLVVRARDLLAGFFDLPPLKIRLVKKLPSGAGLGGGSSDAAFALKLINEECRLGLSTKELQKLAAGIGADCAFFIENKPVFAYGKGDEFEPCGISLKGWHTVLVKPEVSVSTAEAYKLTVPKAPGFNLRQISTSNISEWKNFVVNDFENSVFSQYPEIGEIKRQLYGIGAQYASMSGSGSAVYGIFDTEPDLRNVSFGKNCTVLAGVFN